MVRFAWGLGRVEEPGQGLSRDELVLENEFPSWLLRVARHGRASGAVNAAHRRFLGQEVDQTREIIEVRQARRSDPLPAAQAQDTQQLEGPVFFGRPTPRPDQIIMHVVLGLLLATHHEIQTGKVRQVREPDQVSRLEHGRPDREERDEVRGRLDVVRQRVWRERDGIEAIARKGRRRVRIYVVEELPYGKAIQVTVRAKSYQP